MVAERGRDVAALDTALGAARQLDPGARGHQPVGALDLGQRALLVVHLVEQASEGAGEIDRHAARGRGQVGTDDRRDGLAQQPGRGFHVAELGVAAGGLAQQRDLDDRLLEARLADELGRAVELLPDRARSATRRVAQHELEELVVAALEQLLLKRLVALAPRRRRLAHRQLALLLGPVRLPDRADEPGDDRHEREAARSDRAAMAPHEARRTVGQGVGPGAHRFVRGPAAQVLGERIDRLIALARRLLQRLGHDVLEIAAELALQPQRGGVALRGDARDVARRRAVAHGDGVGQRPGIAVERRPHQVSGGRALRHGRMLAAQELIEEDAERIDVGRRGDGLAA